MRHTSLSSFGGIALAGALLVATAAPVALAQDYGKNIASDQSKDAGAGTNASGTGHFAALPFHVTATVRGGYDDNTLTTAVNRQSSYFTSADIGLSYDFGNSRTRLSLTSGVGVTYYFDRPGRDYDYNANLSLAVTHKATPRLTLSASALATYQAEPDFSLNIGTNRQSGNFFYTSDRVTAAYQWAPKFSTATSYTFAAVKYENSAIGFSEDRIENTFGNEFRFLLLPTTTAVAEVRFQIVSYEDIARDSTSEFLLAGVDHSFNPRFNISLRGGVEFRQIENSDDRTSPYFEGTLNYSLGRRTSVSWTNRYALEQPDVVGAATRETFRTGLQVKYGITPRLSSSLGFFYQHDENKGSTQNGLLAGGASDNFAEDSFSLSLGAAYQITRYLSVDAGYSWSEVYSEIALREYSRNRYYLGLSATF